METALEHFIKRAQKYNSSARWVDDKFLIRKLRDLARAKTGDCILDIGTGTGKIAQVFYKRVKYVVGVDICGKMAKQARASADQIVLAAAEKLPFKANTFSLCVCRQGLQFMGLQDVLEEIHRVLKPAGRVVLCHLSAYGGKDKKDTFYIQSLRNPARKNFFLPDDIPCLLKNNAFREIESFEHISRESVNQWTDNGAISKNAKEQIKQAYRNASCDFRKIHRVRFKKRDIFDSMKMVIVRAKKRATYA